MNTRKKKLLPLLMAVLLSAQLLPLNTVFAAEAAEGGEAPGTESLSAAATPFASGGTSAKTDLTGIEEYLIIHGTTGDNHTQIKVTAPGGAEIHPDGSGVYKDIPSGSEFQLQLGFHLSDGSDDHTVQYTYDGSEYFTYQLPKGINYSTVSGSLTKDGVTIADWVIDPATSLLTVNFKSAIKGMSEIGGYIDMRGTFGRIDSGGQTSTFVVGSEIKTLERPATDPLPPAGKINLDKSGTYDPASNTITWKVIVTPSGSDNIGGYQLVDTFSDNQTFVSGSFKVGSTTIPDATLSSGTVTSPIAYTFPDPTTGQQVVTYQTTINSGLYDKTKPADAFKNNAQILNKDKAEVAVKEIALPVGSLIKKEGSALHPDANGKIDWKITLTLPEARDADGNIVSDVVLHGAKIIDHMDSRLEISGAVSVDFGDGTTEIVSFGSAGEEGKYNIAGSDMTYTFPSGQPKTGKTVTLTYSTVVTDWENARKSGQNLTFTNSAEFSWIPGDGSGPGPGITFGSGEIKKVASVNGLVDKRLASGWASESQYVKGSEKSGDYIKWTVTVNSIGATMTNAYIIDKPQAGHELFIDAGHKLTVKKGTDTEYERTELAADGTKFTLNPDGVNGFKYSFTDTSTSATYTVEFYTRLTDAAQSDMYEGTQKQDAASKKTKDFVNNVLLHRDGPDDVSDSAKKTYNLKMLEKSILTGYDATSHSIQWQLVVNRNQLPLGGGATVTDTVQEGMVFDATKPITLKPTGTTDGTPVTLATSAATDSSVDGALYALANEGRELTITLPSATDTSAQFTITYWTKVTDDALRDPSFWTGDGGSRSKAFTNQAVLTASGKTASTDFTTTVKNPVITKNADTADNGHKDVVSWTAVVNRAKLNLTAGVVTDVLDSKLALVPGSVTLHSTALNSSGNPTGTETAVTLNSTGTTRPYYTCDASEDPNTLKVYLPESSNNAYILRFQTLITEEISTGKIGNSITLADSSDIHTNESTGVNINEITNIGTMHSNSITVTKTDKDGNPIPGARFQLYNNAGNDMKRIEKVDGINGDNALRNITRVTDVNGQAVFNNLPKWAFQVAEIDPPAGFVIDSKAKVFVGTANGAFTYATAWEDSEPFSTLTVYKKGDGGVDLSGGTFRLTGTPANPSRVPFAPVDVAAVSGAVTFTNVPMGTYNIEETAAPDNHILPTTHPTVTVNITLNSAKTGVDVKYTYGGSTGMASPTITNTPNPTGIGSGNPDIEFLKYRADNASDRGKATMAGVSFTLKNEAGTTDITGTGIINPAISDTNGKVAFANVPIGKYTIYEAVSDGYLNPASTLIYRVVVSYKSLSDTSKLKVQLFAGSDTAYAHELYNSETSASLLEWINYAATADVEITKQSSAGAGVLVNGGTFQLQGETVAGFPQAITGGTITYDSVAGTYTYTATATAVNGKVIFLNVPVNAAGQVYTITELTPPSGYFAIKDANKDSIKVKVEYDNYTNKTAVVGPTFLTYTDGTSAAAPVFTNDPIPSSPADGKATILKKDENGAPLADAEFTFYDKDGKAVASMTSGKDGLAVFTGLTPYSDYTVRETKAPAGYVLSDEVFTVKTYSGTALSFTMVNKKVPVNAGVIAVLKTDPDGAPLAGAEFTLYDKDGSAVASLTTGADGRIFFEKLPTGAYTVAETGVPEGYVRASGNHAVTLTKNETKSLTVVNERRPVVPQVTLGAIRLTKVNSDREPLAGAEFTLYAEDGSVFAKKTTGGSGLVVFGDLPIGSYTVRETAAPEGYQLAEEDLTVILPDSGAAQAYTLRDAALDEEPEIAGWEDENPQLPKTGGAAPSFFLLLAGLALVVTGFVWNRKITPRAKRRAK